MLQRESHGARLQTFRFYQKRIQWIQQLYPGCVLVSVRIKLLGCNKVEQEKAHGEDRKLSFIVQSLSERMDTFTANSHSCWLCHRTMDKATLERTIGICATRKITVTVKEVSDKGFLDNKCEWEHGQKIIRNPIQASWAYRNTTKQVKIV